jgi:hypothetical protein
VVEDIRRPRGECLEAAGELAGEDGGGGVVGGLLVAGEHVVSRSIWSAWRPFSWVCQMWWWVSMKPGERILLVQSIIATSLRLAVEMLGAILVIMLPVMRMSVFVPWTWSSASWRRAVPFLRMMEEGMVVRRG